ncbi:MAG: hypothetical protein OXD37_07390 [Acidimicrobiaceae bacterium]|nr:hypothetical protein [Acidimicrobiaceae bacterium]
MPHIIIEHSANLAELTDMSSLVDAVHQAALAGGLAEPAALRTRAAARRHYRIADGDPSYGFVAVYARMAPGRDRETMREFLIRLIDTVDEALAPLLPEHPVAVSAEIQLIDPAMRINRNHIRTRLSETPATP